MPSTILLLTLFTLPTFAHAGEDRVVLLAKRVAAMENSRDLPSRAVWLSNRVIRNTRDLAYFSKDSSKKSSKRRPKTVKN